jgi:hypothetical protein
MLRLLGFTGVTCDSHSQVDFCKKCAKLEDNAEALGHKTLMMGKQDAHLGLCFTTVWRCWNKN